MTTSLHPSVVELPAQVLLSRRCRRCRPARPGDDQLAALPFVECDTVRSLLRASGRYPSTGRSPRSYIARPRNKEEPLVIPIDSTSCSSSGDFSSDVAIQMGDSIVDSSDALRDPRRRRSRRPGASTSIRASGSPSTSRMLGADGELRATKTRSSSSIALAHARLQTWREAQPGDAILVPERNFTSPKSCRSYSQLPVCCLSGLAITIAVTR